MKVNRIETVKFLLEKGIKYSTLNKKGLSAENITSNAELSSLIIHFAKKRERERKAEFKKRKEKRL